MNRRAFLGALLAGPVAAVGVLRSLPPPPEIITDLQLARDGWTYCSSTSALDSHLVLMNAEGHPSEFMRVIACDPLSCTLTVSRFSPTLPLPETSRIG